MHLVDVATRVTKQWSDVTAVSVTAVVVTASVDTVETTIVVTAIVVTAIVFTAIVSTAIWSRLLWSGCSARVEPGQQKYQGERSRPCRTGMWWTCQSVLAGAAYVTHGYVTRDQDTIFVST